MIASILAPCGATKARTKKEAQQKDTVLRQKASVSEAFWRTPLIICYLYALALLASLR
jgi:hypothetical protein